MPEVAGVQMKEKTASMRMFGFRIPAATEKKLAKLRKSREPLSTMMTRLIEREYEEKHGDPAGNKRVRELEALILAWAGLDCDDGNQMVAAEKLLAEARKIWDRYDL